MPALSSVRRASTALMSSQSRRSTANSPQRKLETYSVVLYEGPMGLKLIPNPGILRENEVGDISAVVEKAIRQGKSVYCADHSTAQLSQNSQHYYTINTCSTFQKRHSARQRYNLEIYCPMLMENRYWITQNARTTKLWSCYVSPSSTAENYSALFTQTPLFNREQHTPRNIAFQKAGSHSNIPYTFTHSNFQLS
jgi:hypothetical protein